MEIEEIELSDERKKEIEEFEKIRLDIINRLIKEMSVPKEYLNR